ncbi:CLUMA_CG019410, isoform A [Clunio marinus]|uniref:CLUMA_CG019410, isoform A n=1 Tax=Clunio marinus TaxID=568069 RepID=A0A1J1J2L0_9DIPT|nr:CLUMA_CG019410, isoform A [Clunio marinus]
MLAEDVIRTLIIITIITSFEIIQVVSLRTCKSVQLQDGNGIILHWLETPVGEYRPSSPMCIDKSNNILQRRCMEGEFWEDFEPQRCTFYALKKFLYCPYGMKKLEIDGSELCLSVTEPKKWENSCLQFGETKTIFDLSKDKFNEIINYLKIEKETNEFWIPAKRSQSYNPFQMQIIGKNWGIPIHFDDYDIQIKDEYKDFCLKLVRDKDTFNFKSENCDAKLREVCIYDSKSVMELACKNSFTSRYAYHENKCYSMERTTNSQSKQLFKATKLYSRMFIKDLMKSFKLDDDDRCLVDFGNSDYSENFFTNSSFGRYTVIDRDGKWMLANKFTCVIYEEELNMQTPEVFLKYDTNTGKMLLTVYSEEFLWREDSQESGVNCFTIADNELIKVTKIKSRLWSETIKNYDMKLFDGSKSREITKSIYELKLYGSGPGIYWCEGHMIQNLKLIKSKEVIARKNIDGFVLALKLQSKINFTKDSIYDEDFLDYETKELKSLMTNSNSLDFYEKVTADCIKDIRVVKIDSFDKKSLLMTAVYHVTVLKSSSDSSSSSSSSSSEEYRDFMEKYADKFETIKVLVTHQVMTYVESILMKVGGSKYKFLSIQSTEFCLPETIKNPNMLSEVLVWEQAQIGETLPPTNLCLDRSGLPLTRKCIGDFLNGGQWQTLSEQDLQCVDKEILSLHTKRLFSFDKQLNPNETHDVIDNMTSISSHYDQLIPADLFYISRAVQHLTSVTDVTQPTIVNLNSTDLDDKYNLTIIMNNIMNVNASFIQLSQLKLNTTNILLDSYDNLINSLSTNYSIYAAFNNNLINDTDGTFIMRTEKIVVFMCDPGRMNVSGMALIRNPSEIQNNLLDYKIVKLYATQSIDDVLNIYQDTLEIASFFPQELLNRIDEIHKLDVNETNFSTEPVKIVVKVFYNDAIFRESNRVSSYKSQSKIISVSIPGHDENLPLLLPIMFKKSETTQQSDADVCGYWEFQPSGSSLGSSEWMQQGCELLGISKYDENLALCGCSHLTHFAYLIMGEFVHDVDPGPDVIVIENSVHTRALNTITLLGSALSIIGLVGIFVTAVLFRSWREKASTKVLLQLSLAIALQMVLFSFFSTEKHTFTIDTLTEKRACVALGASLHYSVLVTFSWMLITAFLQFKRYVIVLGNLKPERFFLKSFIVGWGMPMIPIVVVLIIDPLLYIPEIYGICYPQGYAFYFSVLLPIGLIVIANLIIFIFVIFNILRSRSANSASLRKNEKSLTLSQLRVSVFLFFLLGLTWIFGLLSSSGATIIFSYLFCLTATIQGFVLFLYFIVMDPITRNLWRESFRSWKSGK